MAHYPKTQYTREIKENDRVSNPFLVKHAAVQTGRTGKPYMNVVLFDQKGELEARIFDQIPKYAHQVVKDSILQVEGIAQSYQGRIQIHIKDATLLREDEVEMEKLLAEVKLDAERLYEELKRWIQSIQDSQYKALMESIFIEDLEIVEKIKKAPAAKSIHHAYPVGLLEHMLSIVKILDFLAQHYAPFVNRDLLLVGGLLHDLGKIWELQYEKTTDYTTEGRLVGHLVMGVELITEKSKLIEEQRKIPTAFDQEKLLLAKHMVLAHHGKLEYGSPKEPACIEALMVHMIDDLDSKVNAIKVFLEQDMMAGSWSAMNKQFERFFYKPEWARKS